jgi:hypothetical protein
MPRGYPTRSAFLHRLQTNQGFQKQFEIATKNHVEGFWRYGPRKRAADLNHYRGLASSDLYVLASAIVPKGFDDYMREDLISDLMIGISILGRVSDRQFKR